MWNDGRAVRNDIDGLALQLRGVEQRVDIGKRLYAHGRNVLRGNARIEQDVVALRLLAVEEENVACDGEMLAQPLLDGAGDELDLDAVACGKLSPAFFGSALTNFGVEPFLKEFLRLAPTPRAYTDTLTSEPVDPCRDDFSGFVFKIQANMDKNHGSCPYWPGS